MKPSFKKGSDLSYTFKAVKIPKNIESHLFKQLSNLVSNEKKERMKRLLNSCDVNNNSWIDLLIRL